MHKWVYDRMVEEYKKESKDELINRLMAESEIEVEDRCFANQCFAGTDVYNINSLFSAISDVRSDLSEDILDRENIIKVCELAKKAKSSWNFITDELFEMKDDSRCGKKLDDFKKRVSKAKDKMDVI